MLETILSKLNLKNKILADFGAGEGLFLDMLKKKKILKKIFGVEPSIKNCKKLNKLNISSINSTIEELEYSKKISKPNIATIMWTLCNCSNPYKVIKTIYKFLKPNGYLVVAEGSRIMVPFKKPINMYIGNKMSPDLHPFHFSKNSLCNLLLLNKFKITYVNRFLDSDVLLIIAKKDNKINKKDIKIDNYKLVKSFFYDWYNYSKKFKSF